ncbi:cation-translocating P-type ATPase [Rhodovulum sp. YNF3179]|uniref:cation-translocating P-type ATPase n=1 Tax=Rhodovulum sp. YNF3179 TaxID=3425127 RepID=UPI003D33C819
MQGETETAGGAAADRAGLTSAEAARRLAEYGPNTLAEAQPVSALAILARQFTGFLVLILIVAAAVAFFLGEVIDTVAITLVVLLNGVLGFVQEWRAETALAALRGMLSPRARVVRDGQETYVETRALVPGDVVILEAGDRVPADIRLSTAMTLQADESALTGESLPVPKTAEDGAAAEVFMGTSIVAGRGEGVVTATGSRTGFGEIAVLTGSVGTQPTHLQRQLSRLARQMGLAALALGGLIAALGFLGGRPPIDMVLTGLSLAVAVVPEGLPAVVTITLALGASAMVRRKALARRLQAVETLGAASVICTDKTGTLTENKMTVAEIWLPGGRYRVTGTGYDPAGHIERDGRHVRHGDDADLGGLLEVAAGCNNARLERAGDDWRMLGEPTEGALMTLAYKGWTPLPRAGAIVAEIPFSSDRKRMSVVMRDGEGGHALLVKGAPEQVLAVSRRYRGAGGTAPLDPEARVRIEHAYAEMAEQGLRVIAFARRGAAGPDDTAEENLEFLGLAGLIDPPRPEVAEAVRLCRSAGIRTVMITGDSPVTAAAIARRLGMPVDRVLTGAELEEIGDAELGEILAGAPLFARSAPAHKMRIVEILQAQGQIVAMTGDGVNDAPALKRADIGVAMGQRGTDVARDAADLVLLDDNFATIVRAVREGRRQFSNVQKFVRYLLSSNAGEVLAIMVNLMLGGPLVFLATQILWMNLVTDGVTAVALGLEPARRDQMDRPPRPAEGPILGRAGLLMILGFGLYTAAASLSIFYAVLAGGGDTTLARTAAFTGMVVFEKVSVFAFRSFTQPCWRIGWTSNPVLIAAFLAMLGVQAAAVYWAPLQLLLSTAPLAAGHWLAIAALALPLVVVPEILKTWLARRAGGRPGA